MSAVGAKLLLPGKTSTKSVSVDPDAPQGGSLAAESPAAALSEAKPSGTRIRSRLFTKYVALFVAVVGVALLSNGIFEVFFYYRAHQAALIRIQNEQGDPAAVAQSSAPGEG